MRVLNSLITTLLNRTFGDSKPHTVVDGSHCIPTLREMFAPSPHVAFTLVSEEKRSAKLKLCYFLLEKLKSGCIAFDRAPLDNPEFSEHIQHKFDFISPEELSNFKTRLGGTLPDFLQNNKQFGCFYDRTFYGKPLVTRCCSERLYS